MLEGILFVAATAGIVYVSRSSLRVPRSHGFYRFFAWEFLLLLFLLNVRRWFDEPFSLHQIVSWLLLLTSLFLVFQGFHLLRRYGKPSGRRDEKALIGIEKTSTLVTTGVYGYIRHPLYSSLLFLGWGTFFKHPSWLGGLLALLATIFLMLTARVEEDENIRFFGTAYQEYMKQSKMFVPYLF
jgi:protein-S-isoprenylcysteine O-methyltransferase Ste14